MRVLVTGATGFIGSRLCPALTAAGHEVLALTRDPVAARTRLQSVAAAYVWSPPNTPPPPEAFLVDAVVNLAGETLKGCWTANKKWLIRRSRVLSTRLLVQGMAATSIKPQVFVSGSASGYYGDRGDERLTEDSPSGSGFLAGVCEEWEREANQARPLGMRVVNLRSGLVLGPGGGALKPLLLACRLWAGGPMGWGGQFWPWVHMEDLEGAVMHALTSPIDGPINVVSPSPVRQRDFARALGRAMGRPAILPAPALALRLLLGEVASELLYSRRALPRRLEVSGYRFRFPTLDAALRDILTGGMESKHSDY